MKTINNPNPIASTGRTNNPNPIASIGRINFKKVISAILLFSLLLFSLLAGANSLQAQERKTGWFVGLSPYAMDLNLEKTTRQTTRQTTNFSSTGGAIVYDATVPNFALNDTHLSAFYTSVGVSLADRLVVANAALADAIHLCREAAVPVVTIEDVHNGVSLGTDIIFLTSYDETTNLTDGLSQLLTNTPPTTIGNSTSDQAAAAPLCQAFFEADLSTSSTSTSDVGSKTQSLQGTGIEFGYDFEKYSLSFNQLQWSGGDDSLQTQMLLFRYFLPYALSVGGGFASAKLDTEFGSDSGTAPVFHFGYDYPITKNFQISLSYAWLGVNLAVQDTQSVTPTTTTSSIQRRAVIGISRSGGAKNNNYRAFKGLDLNNISYDTRIVVTATLPTEVTVQETTTTIQNAEIKNLSTIKIVFRYSF